MKYPMRCKGGSNAYARQFSDYTGDVEESVGIDSNGEFEIRVSLKY